jgi:hypothetical protein
VNKSHFSGGLLEMKTRILFVLFIAIFVLCSCSGGPGPTPDPVPDDPGAIRHIILNACYVTAEWMKFTDNHGGGWLAAIDPKELHGVKFYEAAIWEDTMSIHLYAFPNDYLQKELELLQTDALVPYRESFLVQKFENMPENRYGRGDFVLHAFTEFAKTLVKRHPHASHNLMYNGHGGPNEFFDMHLSPAQATALLSNWHSALGRKLGFVDMGGPCNKGNFHDLEAIHEHANYYIASDLAIGGHLDDFKDFESTEILFQYPRILASHKNLKDALIERVNVRGARLQAGKKAIIADQAMQSMYLYSCSEFAKHKKKISKFMESLGENSGWYDIKHELKKAGRKDLLDALNSIIIHGVDTKGFFPWPEEWNGLFWVVN